MTTVLLLSAPLFALWGYGAVLMNVDARRRRLASPLPASAPEVDSPLPELIETCERMAVPVVAPAAQLGVPCAAPAAPIETESAKEQPLDERLAEQSDRQALDLLIRSRKMAPAQREKSEEIAGQLAEQGRLFRKQSQG